MASIYDIKPKFQGLLRPLTRALAKAGITANQVTLAALGLSMAAGAVILSLPEHRLVLLLLPIVAFVRMALNAIDGMLAREHDMKSDLGGILNELGDVISDSALYLPLAVVAGFSPFLLVPVVLLAVISEMTGVIGVQVGASRRYDGPLGKSDRAFVFGALGLLLGVGVRPEPWVNWILAAMLIGLAVTIFNRSRQALREIR